MSAPTEDLRNFLETLCRRVAGGSAFSVVLVSDPVMQRYNARFRGLDGPTDVLSFPNPSEEWEAPEEEGYLGDIVISVETAERQRQGTLLDELQALSLHGLLHLLGYDHDTDRGEMEAMEYKLKKEFQLP